MGLVLICMCIGMWSDDESLSPGVMCEAKCNAEKLQKTRSGVPELMLLKNVLKCGPIKYRLFWLAKVLNSLPKLSVVLCPKLVCFILKSPIIKVWES